MYRLRSQDGSSTAPPARRLGPFGVLDGFLVFTTPAELDHTALFRRLLSDLRDAVGGGETRVVAG